MTMIRINYDKHWIEDHILMKGGQTQLMKSM